MKKYIIKYQEENQIKEFFIESRNISNEQLPLNIISILEQKEKLNFTYFRKKTISDKKLSLLFYELNLMLRANININDSLNILIKNKKDKSTLEFLRAIQYSLSNGKSISKNLDNFQLNHIVLSFLEICQTYGNLALNINALSQLLIESSDIKKNFIKAISYPIILIISFFISLISIFIFVIPKFKMIFEQSINNLPLATEILLKTQFILENYSYMIFIFLLIISFIFIALYKYNSNFEYLIHKLLVDKIFLIKDIYLNMQLYKLFLVIDIMLKSNYEFHKAFISSKILLKNKYLLDKISLIDNLLQNGKSINDSFLETKIFDDIVLNLINTGEVSNSLGITIDEIKKIYKNKFYDKVNLLTSLIQPLFLIVIMGLILWIVLAIFMPIWNMGTMINV
ncbi:MAG: type II secretion system F family protein [Aliarcobacter sp.]|jgi:general secretion pathway protein F|nr:type II secretion system F family protein [Aliarcobacter sp.]